MTNTDTMDSPLKYSYSDSFVELLSQAHISLLISTYQANRLVLIRVDQKSLNAHVYRFDSPTGIAVNADKLAIGTAQEIITGHNIPAVIPRLKSKAAVDSCYVMRHRFACGNLDIHEMAWSGRDLWFINTRFSCLCTQDNEHSFIPRWRPNFISAYQPEDRCHLNGLGLRDGQPRYVTALGSTDTGEGWRTEKEKGGVLIDINTDEVLCTGLHMPHSPRWYENKLWVLESGYGRLCEIDLKTREIKTSITLPGFTRGLSFWRNFAFVALSKARDMQWIQGQADNTKNVCGIWVVDLISGKIVAALQFDDVLHELFAVEVLAHCVYPELISLESHPEIIGSTYVLPPEALSKNRN